MDPYLDLREKKDKKSLELGYQSDSENESASDTNNNTSDKDDKDDKDDDDMFASDEEVKPKKNPHLLDMGQFVEEQGLENTAFEATIHGAADLEQLQKLYANVEEHDAGKGNQPLPEVQLEAFNLQEEAEHGTFDKDMNYTREANSDEETAEDAWMKEVKLQDIEKAKQAQQSLQKASAKRKHIRDTGDLLQSVVRLLEPAETTMEALTRLSPPKKKRGAVPSDEDKKRRKTVFELTECCEQLSNEKGLRDAYDMSREELMRMYERETGNAIPTGGGDASSGRKRKADQLENAYGDAVWEFRWIGEAEINGPYSSYEMKYWVDNYFENKVEVRRTNSDTFVHVQDVRFDD